MPKIYAKICAAILLFVAATGLLFVGCSSSPEDVSPPSGEREEKRGSEGAGIMQPMAVNASGKEIFVEKCQRCHGANGEGQVGPNLTKLDDSNAQLHAIIHDGHDKMPSFAQELSDAQIDAVIAHVRTLAAK